MGRASNPKVPTKWNGKTDENIAWKVAVPGNGHSSPVIWEDRIFLASCLPDTEERALLCLDRRDGKEIWRQIVVKAPLEKKHNLNSFASGTPVTDGKLVYVTFLEADFGSTKERTPGNLVVAAFDLEGKQKWVAKPVRFASVHGFCSSPILFEDKVIVNGDHDGDSYIVARLDRETGDTKMES